MPHTPSVDLNLARRLERAEAATNAAFVDARARVDSSVGATWIDVAGVYAMFDGVGSPLTQTFGLGLFDSFLSPEFERVEAFFTERGSSALHEVSSVAPDATQVLLARRGYAPIEHSVVLVRPTRADDAAPARSIVVHRINPGESEQWAQLSARGWSSDHPEFRAFIEQIGNVTAHADGVQCFIAEEDGEPLATAALSLVGNVALMAGASTIPAARRRGAQLALLHARLAVAAAHNVELAMVVTQPESASQRNAERQGFRQVYSRTKWERPIPSP